MVDFQEVAEILKHIAKSPFPYHEKLVASMIGLKRTEGRAPHQHLTDLLSCLRKGKYKLAGGEWCCFDGNVEAVDLDTESNSWDMRIITHGRSEQFTGSILSPAASKRKPRWLLVGTPCVAPKDVVQIVAQVQSHGGWILNTMEDFYHAGHIYLRLTERK